MELFHWVHQNIFIDKTFPEISIFENRLNFKGIEELRSINKIFFLSYLETCLEQIEDREVINFDFNAISKSKSSHNQHTHTFKEIFSNHVSLITTRKRSPIQNKILPFVEIWSNTVHRFLSSVSSNKSKRWYRSVVFLYTTISLNVFLTFFFVDTTTASVRSVFKIWNQDFNFALCFF